MTSPIADLRLALRALRRRPGFTATAILTLALGVGVNTLVFTWAKGLVLNPLPGVEAADRLVFLSGTQAKRGGLSHRLSQLEFYRQADVQTLADLAGFEMAEMALGGGDRPVVIAGGLVSGNYFPLLGVRGAAGRLLAESDDRPGVEPVAVLSASRARLLFGSATAAVGRTVRLQGRDIPVVGVADPRFAGTYGGLAQELWLTFSGWTSLTRQPAPGLQIIARLAPEATRATVATEMNGVAGRLGANDATSRGWEVAVLPPTENPRGFIGGMAPLVGVLLVIVALVLAIACANLAGLLLARAIERQRETAIRRSLGANQGDLIRLQLAESLLLALAGALLGLLPAVLLAERMFGLLPLDGFRMQLDLSLDAGVMAATLGVALLAATVASLAPAFASRGASPAQTLRSESAGGGGGQHKTRLRSTLVVVQLALSLAALTAAAILINGTLRELRANPGFDRQGAVVANVNLSALGYDADRGQRWIDQALDRLGALPGVEVASFSTFVPMGVSGGGNGRRIEVGGYTPQPDEVMGVVTDSIAPNYFRALGLRSLRGREFGAGDRAGTAPVAIVTDAFERHYFSAAPGGALGQRVRFAADGEWREIVGVVGDATYRSLSEVKRPRLYVPQGQVYSGRGTFIVRGSGDPATIAKSLRATLAALDPDLPVTAVETLARHTAAVSFTGRIAAILLSGLGALALVLAAVGLFGLLAYSVAARRKEFGVRSALGASAPEIVRLVLRGSARLVAIGAVAGLALTLVLGRLLVGTFPMARAIDPLATAVSLAVLALAAALASVAPALRAARVDPSITLREE